MIYLFSPVWLCRWITWKGWGQLALAQSEPPAVKQEVKSTKLQEFFDTSLSQLVQPSSVDICVDWEWWDEGKDMSLVINIVGLIL